MKLGVGLGPQNIAWPQIRDVAMRTEALGFDSFCLYDHLLPLSPRLDDPVLETWTMMGALADATESIRLGQLVTANTLRAPALLAKMVATVDHISAGRVFLGLGAGYYVAEHRAYGIALPPRRERAAMLDEACQILKGLWRSGTDGGRYSFDGAHYTIRDAPFAPPCVQPGGPPLLIGGAGALTLRTTARHADQWNLPPGSAGVTPDDLVLKRKTLSEHCTQEARDPRTIEITASKIVFVDADRARAHERRRQFAAQRGMSDEVAARHVLAEDPAGVLDELRRWREAGTDHFWMHGDRGRQRRRSRPARGTGARRMELVDVAASSGSLPISRHFVAVGDRDVHYRRCGSGAPIVLLHESPRSSLAYEPLAQRLGRRFTVLALDTPGYGSSDALPQDAPAISDYADALSATLDALGIARFGLYGTHTGAAIALELAVRAPQRVSALVLDGLLLPSEEERRELLERYCPTFEPTLDGGHLIAAWTMRRDMHLFFPWYRRSNEAALRLELPDAASLHRGMMEFLRAGSAYHRGYEAAFRYDAAAALRTLTVPAAILASESDVLFEQLARVPADVPAGVTFGDRPADADAGAAAIAGHLTAAQDEAPPPLPPRSPPRPDRVTRSYATTRHGQLHLRARAGAPARALVAIHGSPTSAATLAPLLERLGRSRPTYAFDTLGNGDSDKPDARFEAPEIADFAAVLAEAIDDVDLERFDLYRHPHGRRDRDRDCAAASGAGGPDHPRRHRDVRRGGCRGVPRALLHRPGAANRRDAPAGRLGMRPRLDDLVPLVPSRPGAPPSQRYLRSRGPAPLRARVPEERNLVRAPVSRRVHVRGCGAAAVDRRPDADRVPRRRPARGLRRAGARRVPRCQRDGPPR